MPKISKVTEAIIGSIYIDRGFEIAKNYILKIWKVYIDKSAVTLLDPKTKLQEYSLKKFKKLPFYRLVNSTGPRHSPTYKIAVSIPGSKQFTGQGNSKQEAQQNGASKLLQSKYLQEMSR